MNKTIEKYLNFRTLAVVNVIIVLLAVLSPDLFFEAGYIHSLAIFFTVIVFFLYFKADRLIFSDEHLRIFFKFVFMVLVVFSSTHVLEYAVLQGYLPVDHHTAEFVVLTLYIVSILLLIAGVKYLFITWSNGKRWMMILFILLSVILALFAIYFLLSGPTEEQLYLVIHPMLIFLFVFAIYAYFQLSRLRELISTLAGFIGNLSYAIVFIVVASLFEYLEVMHAESLPQLLISYLAHFSIYIAISFFILALVKLLRPTSAGS